LKPSPRGARRGKSMGCIDKLMAEMTIEEKIGHPQAIAGELSQSTSSGTLSVVGSVD